MLVRGTGHDVARGKRAGRERGQGRALHIRPFLQDAGGPLPVFSFLCLGTTKRRLDLLCGGAVPAVKSIDSGKAQFGILPVTDFATHEPGEIHVGLGVGLGGSRNKGRMNCADALKDIRAAGRKTLVNGQQQRNIIARRPVPVRKHIHGRTTKDKSPGQRAVVWTAFDVVRAFGGLPSRLIDGKIDVSGFSLRIGRPIGGGTSSHEQGQRRNRKSHHRSILAPAYQHRASVAAVQGEA